MDGGAQIMNNNNVLFMRISTNLMLSNCVDFGSSTNTTSNPYSFYKQILKEDLLYCGEILLQLPMRNIIKLMNLI